VEHADDIDAVRAGHVEKKVCRETSHRSAAHTVETRHAGMVRSSRARLFRQSGAGLIHGLTFGHFRCGVV
jgi:hypothetical protein